MSARRKVAVIGVGTMGAQAAWRLAARGADVIGFDRFAPGHDRSAAGGDTRIFRSAHFDDRTSLNQSMRPSYQHGIRSNFRAMEWPFLTGLSWHRWPREESQVSRDMRANRSERQRTKPCY